MIGTFKAPLAPRPPGLPALDRAGDAGAGGVRGGRAGLVVLRLVVHVTGRARRRLLLLGVRRRRTGRVRALPSHPHIVTAAGL